MELKRLKVGHFVLKKTHLLKGIKKESNNATKL
jgi:hypothetical protein